MPCLRSASTTKARASILPAKGNPTSCCRETTLTSSTSTTSHQGQHQLHISVNDAELPYLHLIDRLNGNDIDLIAQPDYTFSSGNNDYSGRFQLRFAKNNETNGNELFAYCQNGKVIVIDPNPQAVLQVIDMTGRRVNNDQLAPGIYVLRLITPEGGKTQQIVVPN